MTWKAAVLLSAAGALLASAEVKTNYTSTTDPTKISIPDIEQTTSYDVTKECTWYNSPYVFDKASWPTSWEIATGNGMNTSKEFTDLYNSIDWTKAPNIQVRQKGPDGALNMQGYDTQNDPDCWWSASQCMTPKAQGVNADISHCPEPETLGYVSDKQTYIA